MPPKRKSVEAGLADGSNEPPAKKAADASSGERRGRGRPRKNPESAPPAKPATTTPGRGRGRPRKDTASATSTKAATPTKPATPSRGRGRPAKNTSEKKDTTAKPTPTGGKRGRPKKDQETNGLENSKSAIPTESDSAESKQKYEADEDGHRYWLMKAEPESRLEKGIDVKFSIDDLEAATEPEPWDGVRNLGARNHIRAMKQGDYAFFYHSNCKTPGIAGVMEVVREHSADESAFDPAHPYYDEKSSRDNPKWSVVHVEYRRKLDKFISLNDLKAQATPGGPLENLQTLKQSRLSVSPVTPAQWKFIVGMAEEKQDEESAKTNNEAPSAAE